MKRVAIVSPMKIPIPDDKGGAVENLIMLLVSENEKQKKIKIDVYTEQLGKGADKFKFTQFITVRKSPLGEVAQLIINCFAKILRIRVRWYSLMRRVARRMKDKGYDLIVVENDLGSYWTIYQKMKRKTRVVSHLHGVYDGDEHMLKRMRKSGCENWVVSDYVRRVCDEKAGGRFSKVFFNAVDENLFSGRSGQSWRTKYGIREEDVVVGFAGRVSPIKGVLELVTAFSNAKISERAKLLIVGGQWYGKLEEDAYMQEIRAVALPIKERIVFAGIVPPKDMPKVYRTMDIYVVPSLCEDACPCAMIEGMAMGLPIISTNSGGIPEELGDAGIILKKEHKDFVKNLSEEIKRLVNNRSFREKLAKKAEREFTNRKELHKETYYTRFLTLISERS